MRWIRKLAISASLMLAAQAVAEVYDYPFADLYPGACNLRDTSELLVDALAFQKTHPLDFDNHSNRQVPLLLSELPDSTDW